MLLLDLNYDVLHHLVSSIDPHDLPRAVLTCRKIYEHGMPALLSNIIIGRDHRLDVELAQFLTTKPAYSTFVHSLQISLDSHPRWIDSTCDIITACNNVQTMYFNGVEDALQRSPRLSKAMKGLTQLSILRLYQWDDNSEGVAGIRGAASELLDELDAPLVEIDIGPLNNLSSDTRLWEALNRFSGTLKTLLLSSINLSTHDITGLHLPRVHTLRLQYVRAHIATLEGAFPNVRRVEVLDELDIGHMEQNRAYSCRTWRELFAITGSLWGMASFAFTGCRVQYLQCDWAASAEEEALIPAFVHDLQPVGLNLAFGIPWIGVADFLPASESHASRLALLEITITQNDSLQPIDKGNIDAIPKALRGLGALRFLRLQIWCSADFSAIMSLNRATAGDYADSMFLALPSLRLLDLRWNRTNLGRDVFARDERQECDGIPAVQRFRPRDVAELSLEKILIHRSNGSMPWLFEDDD